MSVAFAALACLLSLAGHIESQPPAPPQLQPLAAALFQPMPAADSVHNPNASPGPGGGAGGKEGRREEGVSEAVMPAEGNAGEWKRLGEPGGVGTVGAEGSRLARPWSAIELSSTARRGGGGGRSSGVRVQKDTANRAMVSMAALVEDARGAAAGANEGEAGKGGGLRMRPRTAMARYRQVGGGFVALAVCRVRGVGPRSRVEGSCCRVTCPESRVLSGVGSSAFECVR